MLRRDTRYRQEAKCTRRRRKHNKPKMIHSGYMNLQDDSVSRHCIGLEGRITLCENISFSAKCLYNGLRDFRHITIRATPGEFDPYRWDRGENPLPSESVPTLKFQGNKISIDVPHVLLRLLPNTVVTPTMLSTALYDINAKICPHLTTRDTLFRGARLTAERTLPLHVQK